MKLNLAGKVKVLDSEYREDIVLKMSRLQCKWFFFSQISAKTWVYLQLNIIANNSRE